MGTGKSPTILDGKLLSGHCRAEGLTKITFRAVTIREGLEIGDHTLTCELLKQTADPEGGTEFRLISVMRCVIFCKDKCLYSPTSYNAHSVADFSIC